MPSLSFETGQRTFDINGDPDRTISFCPTDFNFISRLFDAFSSLEEIQTAYQKKISAEGLNPEETLSIISGADREIKETIDAIFDVPAADCVFGNLSSFAMAGGLPLWAGFLVAVMAECDAGFVAQKTTVNPKLEKLIGKYKK